MRCGRFRPILSNHHGPKQRRDLEAGFCLALGVSTLPSDCDIPLTVVSVVELTLGIMCSCLTSFPGFFRYHMPLLESIMSFFSSSLRSLHGSRPLKWSSSPSNTPDGKPSSNRRLATKDVKITLGSRVDGRGHFIHSTKVFATDPNSHSLAEGTLNSPTTTDSAHDATRRDYHELVEEQQQSPSRYLPSPYDHHSQGSRTRSAPHAPTESGFAIDEPAPKTKLGRIRDSTWWRTHQRTNTTRKGYWDLMSFFRADLTVSSGLSKLRPQSDSSAV